MLAESPNAEQHAAMLEAGAEDAEDAGHASEVESDRGDGSSPWVLRLGNYLTGQTAAPPSDDDKPWAVRLGSYLNERRPGPWSLIANEKPQDPLALRLGTFLNETKPIGLLHRNKAGDVDGDDDDEPSAPSAEPLVLRLGNYLQGTSPVSSPSTMAPAITQAAPAAADGSLASSSQATAEPATAGASVVTAVEPGEADGTVGAVGPAWTRGEIEKPAGEKDMGGWGAAVYTEEQQARLSVAEDGTPRAPAQTTETPDALATEVAEPAR